MTRPSHRREMAEKVVEKHEVSIALACRTFGVSETCDLPPDRPSFITRVWLVDSRPPFRPPCAVPSRDVQQTILGGAFRPHAEFMGINTQLHPHIKAASDVAEHLQAKSASEVKQQVLLIHRSIQLGEIGLFKFFAPCIAAVQRSGERETKASHRCWQNQPRGRRS